MGEVSGDDRQKRLLVVYPAVRRFAAVVGSADMSPDDLVHDAIVAVLNGGGLDQIDDVMPGYALTLTNGQVLLLWPTDHPDWWMSMTSEPLIASRINDLAAVIVRS